MVTRLCRKAGVVILSVLVAVGTTQPRSTAVDDALHSAERTPAVRVYRSAADLLKDMPREAYPRFGPDGKSQRAAARKWVQANLVGRVIEWTGGLSSSDNYGGELESPFTMRIAVYGETASTQFLGEQPGRGEGISWGTITLGDQAAQVMLGHPTKGISGKGIETVRIFREYYIVYENCTANEARTFLAMAKDLTNIKTIRLRSTITAADVCDGPVWTNKDKSGKQYDRVPLWIEVSLPSIDGFLPEASTPKDRK